MADRQPRPHPDCWVPEVGRYVHRDCVDPSGRDCVEGCGRRAGTKWGPLWCPQCDVVRLDRVSAGFAAIKAYSDQTKQPARLHMPDQDTQTDRSPQGEST